MLRPEKWLYRILVSSVVLAVALPAFADVEPNNLRHRAEAIEPGFIKGHVGEGDAKDYYSFAIAGGDVIRVSLGEVEGGDDVFVRLRDHEASGLEDLSFPNDAKMTYLTNTELGERVWYLEVSGEGPYNILLDVEPQGDAGFKGDAPKDWRKGIKVGPGIIRGMLDWGDQWDSYRFGVAPEQTIRVRFTANFERFDREMNSIELKLQNAEGSMLEKLLSAGQPATCEYGPLEIEEPETWSLTVGTTGDYRIELSIIGADGVAMEPVTGVHDAHEIDDEHDSQPVEGTQGQVEQQEEADSQQPGDTAGQGQIPDQDQPTEEATDTQEVDHQHQAQEIEDTGTEEDESVSDQPVYVRISLDSVYCVSESDTDRGTNSDEPYFVTTGYGTHSDPAAWMTCDYRGPQVFDDVDDHENRRFTKGEHIPFEGEVPPGHGVGFNIVAMESDDWGFQERANLAEHIAEQTATAVTDHVGAAAASAGSLPDQPSIWEAFSQGGPGDPLGWLGDLAFDALMDFIHWIVGGDDDRIGTAAAGVGYDELAEWSQQGLFHTMPTIEINGGDEGRYVIRWHLEFAPNITRGLGIRFTPWDALAVGNILGDSKAEILTACDEDASGNDGRFRVYSEFGDEQASFDVFYTHYDRVAVGNVRGGEYEQIIVAADDNGGFVNIYDSTGGVLYGFQPEFKHFDGLAVGDVMGDELEEILIANKSDDTVRIYDGHGQELGSFGLDWNFRGCRYATKTGRDDAFLVGDVTGDEYAEIVMLDNESGNDSQIYIYTATGQTIPVQDPGVFFTNRDDAVLADLDGDGKCRLVIAIDSSSGGPGCTVDIYDLPSGLRSGERVWPILTGQDAFAAGDILGVGSDQLVVATNQDNAVYFSR